MTKRLDTVVITYHHYIHRHDHYDDRDHHHHHNCHHHHRYRFLDRISARLLTSIIPIQSLTQTIKRQDGGPTSIIRTPQTKSSEEEIFVGGNYVIVRKISAPPVWLITNQACHVVQGAGPDRFPNIRTKDIRCTTLPECPVCDRRPCSTSLMPFFRSRDFCHIVHVPPDKKCIAL